VTAVVVGTVVVVVVVVGSADNGIGDYGGLNSNDDNNS
jgi:hypothetical protein